MSAISEAEELLRSAALQTSNSILHVRRRAEDELIQAKKALERQAEELARSVAMTRATLESTTDGILVTDGCGNVTDYNQKYAEMWRVPRQVMARGSAKEVRMVASVQLKDPVSFLNRILEIEGTSPEETNDSLHLEDGRVFERHSSVQCIKDRAIGRVWSFRDITERVQSEIVARRLAAIVDSSNDAIVGKDLNLIITSWNAGAQSIFGYTAAEMIGTSILRLVPPERYAEEDVIREQIRSGARVEPMETVRVAKDGRHLDISVTVSPIKDSAGNVIGASKVARDITERKRSERARQIGEARNAAVVRSALDCIVMINQDSVVLEWNPASERTFGYTRAEALGRPMQELIVPRELREKHLADMKRFMSTGETNVLNRRIEVPAMHADGHEMLVELAITAIPVDGPPVFTAYLRDLTEQRRNERALEQSHALLRAVIEGTEDAVFAKDLEGRYQLINPAGARFLGASPAEVVGHRDEEFFSAENAASTVASDRAVIAAEESQTYEDSNEIDGEVRTFLSTKGPYRDGAGKVIGIVGISREITERKRYEEALTVAKNEAETANRAKSEFLSRMSHELRTPLNSILGFSQLLDRDDLSPTYRERVGYIYRAGRHLLELIDEVLDISRIEAGHIELSLQPVRMKEALGEACGIMQPLADARHIRIVLPNETSCASSAMADRQRLKQVLLNLLGNAVKYNRDGGSVILNCEEKAGGRIRVSVTDSGSGIAPEKQSRLFQPFDRLGAEHTSVQGTGLGLALSKRLTEAMSGTIGFVSDTSGSTFWIEIPLSDMPRAEGLGVIETVLPRVTPVSYDRTLLYIEDNLSNVTLIEHLLSDQPGTKLITTMQGLLGLELAARHRPDLILLDVHLPDIDGHEVLKRLKSGERTSDLPVVVLSADATRPQIDRLRAAGAADYLTKPIDVNRFFQVIDEQLSAPANSTS